MRAFLLSMCTPARALLVVALWSWAALSTRTPPSARSAPSPSIPPMRGRSFGSGCRRTNTNSSNWWSMGAPIGSRPRAGRASSCDVLVISGHFDSQTEFYSDRLAKRESLAVSEMERAACSDSCPGVFSQLKEVYLFGCNTTMNPQPIASASPGSRAQPGPLGAHLAEAQQLARTLDQRHGESGREHMRRIFANVPAIYGFSGQAPLGPAAAANLNRYFESASTAGTRQRPREPQAPQLFRRERTEWWWRAASPIPDPAARLSARCLPFRRRARFAGGQARFRPRPPAPRHGGGPHVPRAHRGIVLRVDAGGREGRLVPAGAGRDRARRGRARPVPALRGGRRPADNAGAHDRGSRDRSTGCRRSRAARRNSSGWSAT